MAVSGSVSMNFDGSRTTQLLLEFVLQFSELSACSSERKKEKWGFLLLSSYSRFFYVVCDLLDFATRCRCLLIEEGDDCFLDCTIKEHDSCKERAQWCATGCLHQLLRTDD